MGSAFGALQGPMLFFVGAFSFNVSSPHKSGRLAFPWDELTLCVLIACVSDCHMVVIRHSSFYAVMFLRLFSFFYFLSVSAGLYMHTGLAFATTVRSM